MKLALINAGLFLINCATWACLDYMYVRAGSDSGSFWRNSDWLLLPVFLLIIGVNAKLLRGSLWRRFGVSLAIAFAQAVLLLIVVVTFGIPFHLSIGGQL